MVQRAKTCSGCIAIFLMIALQACGARQNPAKSGTQKENSSKPTVPDGITLSDARAWAKTSSLVIVDVRAPEKFKAAHIPNAISFPMSDSIDAALTDFLKRYSQTTPLLIYCESDECPLAMDFALRLTNQCGYTDARYLLGGFEGWEADGAKALDP
jgi:rhodanese-related sulfurtransferase